MMATIIAELEPFRAVLTDVRRTDSGLHAQLSKFFDHIERRARTRGWHTYMLVDLPDLGKAIDKGLSTGSLNFSMIPKAFGTLDSYESIVGSWIYQTFLSVLFETNGKLDVDVDAEHVFYIRQLCYMFKKYRIACTQEVTESAVWDFVSIDHRLREPTGTWSNDAWVRHASTFSDTPSLPWEQGITEEFLRVLRVLDAVCIELVPSGDVDIYDIIPRHGPGAVSDKSSTGDKYLFPCWPSKLDGTFPRGYFGHVNEELARYSSERSSPKEFPVRLLAVPKTYKGPRLIAAEPTAHQFIQQGLMKWLRLNLTEPLRRCIDFTSQQPSQEAARDGSITGEYATVDLSAASDRLSCWTVERVFGRNQSLLEALHASRSRYLVDGTGTDPELSLRLKKFAAQGSAVTFPVQTICYSAFCITAVLVTEGKTPSRKNILRVARKVQVFGDDIVLPSSAVPILRDLLTHCQLVVNESKTHDHGFFREACGSDWYKGESVTPIYLAHHALEPEPSAEDLVSWVEVSNNYHVAGLWAVSSWMLNQIPEKLRRLIVVSDSKGSGIRLRTFSKGSTVTGGRERFSKTLHRTEALALVLKTRTKKRSRGTHDDLLDYFLQAPSPETYWSHGYVVSYSLSIGKEWVPVT